MENIKNIISEIEPLMIEYRRDFHKHPELGFEEKRSAKKITNRLNELGYEVKEGIAGTGVVGLLEGAEDGPTIALRADMDALPIEEQTGLPFASVEDSKMHACGHDGHMAILMGTAEVLARIKDQISGTIKLIFQPAEEGPGGAEPMIEEGVLSSPEVDAIFGLHIAHDISAGQIGVKKGAMFASIDEIDIDILGNSSHGASPHQGIDSVLVASELVGSLQSIISRNIDPIAPGVITIGKIEGGYRRNIIADKVRLEGTVRCVNPEIRKRLEDKIKEKIKGITTAYGADYKLEYRHMYPPLINDTNCYHMIKDISGQVLGEENVVDVEEPTLGGEDFAYFLEEVPGCYFWLGGENKEKGIDSPNHNPHFTFDESVMKYGVEVFIRALLKAGKEI